MSTANVVSAEEKVVLPLCTFCMGGNTKEELRYLVDQSEEVGTGPWVLSMLQSEDFTVFAGRGEFVAALVTAADLGIRNPDVRTILSSDMLRRWSERNEDRIPAGHVLDVFPSPEAAVRLRFAYRLPVGARTVFPATPLIQDPKYGSSLFSLQVNDKGKQGLGAHKCCPNDPWLRLRPIVYWLRPKHTL